MDDLFKIFVFGTYDIGNGGKVHSNLKNHFMVKQMLLHLVLIQ